jgi:pimeloyl-ACP methyl ester carboxylesterase
MKILAVNGGPGLGSSYLKPWVEKLGDFVLYNQAGCGWDTTPAERVTVDRTVAQFAEMVKVLSSKEPIGILAHSWGSHVVLGALKANPDIAKSIRQTVFVCPAPLTSARLRAAGERLRARMPAETTAEIEALFADGSDQAGAELMRLALPYYVADPAKVPDMRFHYRIPVYRAVTASLGEFDFRKVKVNKIGLSIIRGAKDYLKPTDSTELDSAATIVMNLPDVGHFPFAEAPEAFAKALARLLPA